MITFKDILDNFAVKHGYKDWEDMFYDNGVEIGTKGIEEISNNYAIEVAKQALINASENAELEEDGHSGNWCIDKQSILSETNIPKLD